MTHEDYERELRGDRDEVAAVVDGVADGIRAGALRLGDGEDAVRIETPDSLTLEIELETDDDEVELELELAWPTPADGSEAVTPVERQPATADTVSGEPASGTTDDAEREVTVAEPDATATETKTDESATEAAADESATGAGDPADAVGPIGSVARFELFRDRADEWRWRLRHHNGNIIATSGEGYTRKHNAKKGLQSVVRNAPGAELTEESMD